MSAKSSAARRGSFATLAAFILGVPLGIAAVSYVESGALGGHYDRYVGHLVEKVEVVVFFCGSMLLLLKLLKTFSERAAFLSEIVPEWHGDTVPAEDATKLLAEVEQKSSRLQNSALGRRIVSILHFVQSRRSANELDDQMRALSDGDHMSLENSYSLLRFFTWSIPILGFLGTVLGITESIAGVTPEKLEKGMSGVTDGLAMAFDATALGLGLTMVLMFLSFIVERVEGGVIEKVDEYVDLELAHRFERTRTQGTDNTPYFNELHRQSDVLLKSVEKLVETQVSLWNKTVTSAHQSWESTGIAQQQKVTAGLEEAMKATLARHAQRLIESEEKLLVRQQAMINGVAHLAESLQKTGQDQQKSLTTVATQLAESLQKTAQDQQKSLTTVATQIAKQSEVLGQLQEGEVQLLRLQETLQQNLQSLTNAGMFEEAVQSLTAAIHLLTTRVSPTPASTLKKSA